MRLLFILPVLGVLVLGGSSGAREMQPPTADSEDVQADAPALRREIEVRQDFRRMPFPAEVLGVIDGDTFEARVTIWLGHEVTTRVRLLGIDAAEMGSECAEERAMAEASRAALAGMLGRRVLISDVRFDKYGGRVLARALGESGIDVSGRMLAAGYAIVYDGGRRQAWCGPLVTSRK